MIKTEITKLQKADRLPYEAPVMEVLEYLAEEGFKTSHICDKEEVTMITGVEGDYEVGGEWF